MATSVAKAVIGSKVRSITEDVEGTLCMYYKILQMYIVLLA